MEVLVTDDEYLLVKDGSQSALCASRVSPTTLTIKDRGTSGVCVGSAGCLVGILKGVDGDPDLLLLAAETEVVGLHPYSDAAIRLIRRLIAVPLDATPPPSLLPCTRHSVALSRPEPSSDPPTPASSNLNLLQRSQQKLTQGLSKLQKPKLPLGPGQTPTEPIATVASSSSLSATAIPPSRKLIEEILRLFNDQPSFYFADGGEDLTKSVAQLCKLADSEEEISVEDCFMWNWDVSSALRGLAGGASWVVPVVYGFVGQRAWVDERSGKDLRLTLISRRSRHRAGTRYIKRGIDDEAAVANFVESEQVLHLDGHSLAFTQVRGSVPLFWAQPGYKYRPPPRLTRPKEDSLPVFRSHLERTLARYQAPLVLLNLINQVGAEHTIGQAFLNHVLDVDNENVVYAAFDFHEHCKGLKFQNVEKLITALEDSINAMKFTWACNKSGAPMCRQKGVFRVNCIDCLDRTNVVEMYLGRRCLELQLTKLGLLSPEEELGASVIRGLNGLWADNGDCISRQYAGTAALKGDFTRSGQRNLAGLVRDGVNSASRYYLSHVRDATRQAAINRLLGCSVALIPDEEDEDEEEIEHESLRLLVQEWQRFFLPDEEGLLGAWALIDADADATDVDSVFLLTRDAVYVGEYCEEMDKFTDCARVPLAHVAAVQVGPMSTSSWNMKKGTDVFCLRVLFAKEAKTGEVVTFRAGKTRLFNNMAIPIKSEVEAEEYVRAIGEQLVVAIDLARPKDGIRLETPPRLERRSGRLSSLLSGVAGAGGALKGAGGALRSRLAIMGRGKPELPAFRIGLGEENPTTLTASSEGLGGAAVPLPSTLGVPSDGLRSSRSEGSGLGLMEKIGAGTGRLLGIRSDPTSLPHRRVHPFQDHLARIHSSKSTIILL